MIAPTSTRTSLTLLSCLIGLVALVSADSQHNLHQARFTGRREARDTSAIVMGKFRAPAPERITRFRVPKGSDSSSQVLSASFRVAEASDNDKLVHGLGGASLDNQQLGRRQGAQQQAKPKERKVSAVIQVSDEGLNYPPSKLSADIHGNVAEIVTAPPEAVDQDVFMPEASRFFGRGH